MADLTMCPGVPAATLAGVSCPSANERFLVPERPIIVFDVNETLLDLEAIRPVFDRIFNDPAAMRQWFAGLITYSEALTPQPVVLLYCAQHLGAGHVIPGHHAFPFHQGPAWPSRPVCTSSDLRSAAGSGFPLGGARGR